MSDKKPYDQLEAEFYHVLELYHLTLEYVGYRTLPFLPGWSHYEALKYDPVLFEHHEKQYQTFLRHYGQG